MKLDDRTKRLTDPPPREEQFVLYWMEHARRLRANFALDRAVAYAVALQKPLVIVEALRLQADISTRRSHQFVLDGMQWNLEEAGRGPATYIPCVERTEGEADALLQSLAKHAAVIVTDESPTSRPTPTLTSLPLRVESVDTCGLLPLSTFERAAPSAFVFRRWVQGVLSQGWRRPLDQPLTTPELPTRVPILGGLSCNHSLPHSTDIHRLNPSVGVTDVPGGGAEGARLVAGFVSRVADYPADRNHPDKNGVSGLSPHLHHGHVGATEVVDAVIDGQGWSEDLLGEANGKRKGWWGLDEGREAFLEQLVVWRELGFHFAHHVAEPDSYATLPGWALETLERHALDERPVVYTLAELEQAATHDPVWNAAQRELTQTGRMHNYMRMLWGKKILEWSPTPEQAFDRAVYLNDKWALDGRDPNSYSGIGWVFGRFDRPWGPRRLIFGTIRYMSSDSAKKKLRMKEYLRRFAATELALFG